MLAVFGIGMTELIILGVLSLGCLGIVGVVAVIVIMTAQGSRKRD